MSYDELMKNPRRLQGYSFLVMTTAIVLAVLCYFFVDVPLSRYFDNEAIMSFRKISRRMTDIGLSENFFILSSVVFLLTHWLVTKTRFRKHVEAKELLTWLKKWSLNLFISLIFSGIILLFFKFLIGRQRPHMSDTYVGNVFDPIQWNSHFQSMPSGHSQVLFCAATLLSLLWPRATWVIFLVCFYLAFTRVIVHAHFLGDVLVGASMGHVATLWALRIFGKRFPQHLSLSK